MDIWTNFLHQNGSKPNKRLNFYITKPNHTQNLPSCPISGIFKTSFVNNPQNLTCLISSKLDPCPVMSYA